MFIDGRNFGEGVVCLHSGWWLNGRLALPGEVYRAVYPFGDRPERCNVCADVTIIQPCPHNRAQQGRILACLHMTSTARLTSSLPPLPLHVCQDLDIPNQSSATE